MLFYLYFRELYYKLIVPRRPYRKHLKQIHWLQTALRFLDLVSLLSCE